MKYYIIAGEASGDLHGSNLIKEIKLLDPAADLRVWGGDKMEAAGGTLVKHYRDLAFMGFVEVIKHLPTILKNLQFCKEDILQFKPDALILIDYPGFNLRLVKWAKENDLRVIFYISPQVWAWKESRVKLIIKYVDKMLVILPFEKGFYKKWNYDVEYVGHPLVKVVEDFRSRNREQGTRDKGQDTRDKEQDTRDKGQGTTGNRQWAMDNGHPDSSRKGTGNIIALLPGSRKQEIKRKLPLMLEVSKYFPEYEFVVAKAPGIHDEFYTAFLSPYKNVRTAADRTYSILNVAKAALVTSGTATLETALFEVPEVVCYKANEISYQIAKRLIKLKYISLVNLIMDKEVVKELIQDELTVENLTHELRELLTNEERRKQVMKDYADLKNLLSKGRNASANAAKIVVQAMSREP
jgi:lipid-A-disaccharide synthase